MAGILNDRTATSVLACNGFPDPALLHGVFANEEIRLSMNVPSLTREVIDAAFMLPRFKADPIAVRVALEHPNTSPELLHKFAVYFVAASNDPSTEVEFACPFEWAISALDLLIKHPSLTTETVQHVVTVYGMASPFSLNPSLYEQPEWTPILVDAILDDTGWYGGIYEAASNNHVRDLVVQAMPGEAFAILAESPYLTVDQAETMRDVMLGHLESIKMPAERRALLRDVLSREPFSSLLDDTDRSFLIVDAATT